MDIFFLFGFFLIFKFKTILFLFLLTVSCLQFVANKNYGLPQVFFFFIKAIDVVAAVKKINCNQLTRNKRKNATLNFSKMWRKLNQLQL